MRYGMCRIEVNALNSCRLIGQLEGSGIELYNIDRYCDILTFEIKIAQKSQAIALFERVGKEYRIVKENNSKQFVKKLVNASGYCLAVLCLLISMVVFQFMCIDVDVQCKDYNTRQLASRMVKDYVGKEFFFKESVDTEQLNIELVNNLEKVAYVQSYYKGSRLVVEILLENTTQQEGEQFENIVAECDGIVERIYVTNGTALVKVGDSVKKGQVLIAGYINMGDPNDPNNVQQPTKASGVVMAKVWQTKRLVVGQTYTQEERTGNCKKVSYIDIFGWKIGKNKDSPYGLYQEEKKQLVVGSLFPIKIIRTCYWETNATIMELDEKYKENLIAYAQIEMNLSIMDKMKLIDNWNVQKIVDNLCIIDIYYQLEGDIAVGSNG